jgi:tRNA 2-thiouridine synthesizing protein A
LAADPHRLDTTGKVCPLPILLTAKAMLRLAVGEELEVLGDDPAIAEDMPIYCARAGHRLVDLTEDPDTGVIRCRLEKLAPG